jgi:hypothetical protein
MEAQERRRSARWAPWWVYLIAIVVTNQVRTRWLVPEEAATWLEVVIGLGSIALVVALVTVVYRVTRT